MSAPSIVQRILLPLDGSDLAMNGIGYVQAIEMPGSEIVLLSIVSDPTPMTELAGSSDFHWRQSATDKSGRPGRTSKEYAEIGQGRAIGYESRSPKDRQVSRSCRLRFVLSVASPSCRVTLAMPWGDSLWAA